jgi:flavin reductase (DIM6/NTAB) family NADH-FMN oxidoreductase RutF
LLSVVTANTELVLVRNAVTVTPFSARAALPASLPERRYNGSSFLDSLISDLKTILMQIDPAQQSVANNYKLLTNLVMPRPIAWVTTKNTEGKINLAPFSFFNAVGSDPIYLVVSIGVNDAGGPKDTLVNIRAGGEFVVNLVTEDLFEAMNISAADFPPDQSELDAAGLEAAPSVHVKVPRVARAQASLECRLHDTVALGVNTLVIGRVVMFHVADQLIGPRLHVNGFAPLGRMGSPSVYCRTTDRFDVARISYAQWREGQPEKD